MDKNIIELSKTFQNYNFSFAIDNFQIKVYNFMVETFEGIRGFETHQHSNYELHYIKDGLGSVSVKGQTHVLKPGDLYLISPLTRHSQIVYDDGMVEYALRFDIQKLSNYANNESYDQEVEQVMSLLDATCNRIFPNQSHLESTFERGYTEVYHRLPGFLVTVKQIIMEIIVHTARLSMDSLEEFAHYDVPAYSVEIEELELITEYIMQHISSHITNKMLADHIHISQRQLHRLIGEQVGISPHQYLITLRINYVKDLLDKHSFCLKTISEMTGFSSEFHLSNTFKKQTGTTPRQYIKASKDWLEYNPD